VIKKRKQKKNTVKTIKYRPGTEEGDYQIKFRNLVKFLDNGDKVKVSIWFRGREMQHRELGMEMLDRIEKDTEEFANVEQKAKMEGRQLGMMLAPKSKRSNKLRLSELFGLTYLDVLSAVKCLV
jgi:bacterial translation initiation factor 3 (bIF-3)